MVGSKKEEGLEGEVEGKARLQTPCIRYLGKVFKFTSIIILLVSKPSGNHPLGCDLNTKHSSEFCPW